MIKVFGTPLEYRISNQTKKKPKSSPISAKNTHICAVGKPKKQQDPTRTKMLKTVELKVPRLFDFQIFTEGLVWLKSGGTLCGKVEIPYSG